jgi:hypothetical protein
MNDALAGRRTAAALDAQGALVDGDMGAYYTWLNQMRLTGADESAFLVWFENHTEALVISPFATAGTESSKSVDLTQLIDEMRV